MCYIVCHAQVPHLVSEYAFIDDFMDEFVLHAEPGYCVTTLSMVISFLADTDIKTLLETTLQQRSEADSSNAGQVTTATV